MTDEQAMALALAQAHKAAEHGEVPVGAVVLHQGRIIGAGCNAPIATHDPTAHAEIVALRAAAVHLGNYRLDECELFVTLEPCAMCSGAMLHARLARVVFGAADPKTGAAGSVVDLFAPDTLNHRTRVRGGVLGEECGALLRTFFQAQRQRQAGGRMPLREDALRTPAQRFAQLADHPWTPRSIHTLPGLKGLVLSYLDESGQGGAGALTLLCVHGAHGWNYDFRTMLPVWTAAGHRVVAVDLPGFGRSDKPKRESAHGPAWHRDVLEELVSALDLHDIVLVLQGTGGLLALDLARRAPARCRGIVALRADLARAVVQRQDPGAWPSGWQATAPGRVVEFLRQEPVHGASDAPFPDAGHRAGPRAFLRLATAPYAAPEWPAAVTPASAQGGAALAACLMDGFTVGYSRP